MSILKRAIDGGAAPVVFLWSRPSVKSEIGAGGAKSSHAIAFRLPETATAGGAREELGFHESWLYTLAVERGGAVGLPEVVSLDESIWALLAGVIEYRNGESSCSSW
jgi:hypothetical protein